VLHDAVAQPDRDPARRPQCGEIDAEVSERFLSRRRHRDATRFEREQVLLDEAFEEPDTQFSGQVVVAYASTQSFSTRSATVASAIWK